MKPSLALTRRWPAAVEQLLADEFEVSLNSDDTAYTAAELRQLMTQHDALGVTVTDVIDASVLTAPNCRVKLIANFGVGYNHIDLKAAHTAGIAVTNTPGVLTDCTADLALTLLLMTARRAGEGEREVRAGLWSGWRPTHLLGTRVTGKTLGIVGAGRIGLATARRAHHGFGMKILLHSRSAVDSSVMTELQATQMPLESLLEASDFVSLHCPSSPETYHLLDEHRLGRMSRNAILVNTARGDVVDEAALINALQRGTIAGAGLDVFAREPLVPDALLACPNLVVLPHLGSATQETREAMGMRAVSNLQAYFAGDTPPDLLS